MGSYHSLQIIPSNEAPPKKFIIGIIDLQNDFCKDGTLAVDEADFIIGPINKLRYLYDEHIKTFISQDWHNINHMSFATSHNNKKAHETIKLTLPMEDGTENTTEQTLWPTHCVENTYGSQLHKDLIIIKNDKFIKKGTKKNVESYSAFGDADGGKYEKTDLHNWLQLLGITDIILTGLATDYCVYNTAKDAIKFGYKVHIIYSCTRGVAKNTTADAIKDLHIKGAIFYESVDDFNHKNKQDIINHYNLLSHSDIKNKI